MSRKQPVGQVRLTNIAVVRYKTKGLRFEIACFPNKVLDWRKKVEKDLSNVIQSTNIFSNVSKGSFARRDDVMTAFGTLDTTIILQTILDKGELQITEKERQNEIGNRTREIINIVTGMCVNSETKQPISNRVIEQALKESAFQINLTQPVKQQAMKVLRLLSQTLPIERVKMKVLISSPAQHTKTIKTILALEQFETSIKTLSVVQTQHSIEFTIVLDPGLLREMTEIISNKTNGQGDVSVIDLQADTDDLLAADVGNDDNDDDGIEFDDDGEIIDIGPSMSNDHKEYNNSFVPLDLDDIGNTFNPTAQIKQDKQQQNNNNIKPSLKSTTQTMVSNDDDYSDSDDDIAFILSKSVTVLKDENNDESTLPTQIIQKSTISTTTSNNDDNENDDDDDSYFQFIEKQKQRQKAQFITDNTSFDENDLENDDYLDTIDTTPHTQHQSNQSSSQNSKKGQISHFLITNMAKHLANKTPVASTSTSVWDSGKHSFVSKYDPQLTLYKEFMFHFDTKGEEVEDLPVFKDDIEMLHAVKRHISRQQQLAMNDEFEWVYEYDGDEDDEEQIGHHDGVKA